MITIKELIEELQKMDPNRVVICQSDPEGNCYSPLAGADNNAGYLDGEVYQEHAGNRKDLTEEDLTSGHPGCIPCVVLWPMY